MIFEKHINFYKNMSLNPVMLKELRQIVRNKFVTGIIWLYLLILIIVLGVNTLGSVFGNLSAGRSMLQAIIPVIAVTTAGCIPLFAFIRMTTELSDSRLDLMFTTSLSPWAMVRGKFYANLIVALVIISACTPFLAITYMLRGIDIPTIFLALAFLIVMNTLAIQAGLMAGALPFSANFKKLIGIVFMGSLMSCVGSVVGFTALATSSGASGLIGSLDFWYSSMAVLGIIITLLFLFYVLSATALMPQSANKAIYIRTSFLVTWIVTVITASILEFSIKENFASASVFTAGLIGIIIIMFASNDHDAMSRRIRTTISRNPSRRQILFFFYPGMLSGLILSSLIFLFTCAYWLMFSTVFRGIKPSSFSHHSYHSGFDMIDIGPFAAFYMYAVMYMLMGVFIQRKFLYKFFPRQYTCILGLILMPLCSLLPSCIALLCNVKSWTDVELFQIGNIFAVWSDNAYDQVHLISSFGLLMLFFMLNRAWMFEQARMYKPIDTNETAENESGNPQRTA